MPHQKQGLVFAMNYICFSLHFTFRRGIDMCCCFFALICMMSCHTEGVPCAVAAHLHILVTYTSLKLLLTCLRHYSSSEPSVSSSNALKTSPISALTTIPCPAISFGQTASPLLIHAYVALGFSAVIRWKGYLIMPGVL